MMHGLLTMLRRSATCTIKNTPPLISPPPEIKRSLFETESEYQYIRVVDDGHGGRELELNEGVVSHSAWRPDTVLTGRYWDLFLLFPNLLRQLAGALPGHRQAQAGYARGEQVWANR